MKHRRVAKESPWQAKVDGTKGLTANNGGLRANRSSHHTPSMAATAQYTVLIGHAAVIRANFVFLKVLRAVRGEDRPVQCVHED